MPIQKELFPEKKMQMIQCEDCLKNENSQNELKEKNCSRCGGWMKKVEDIEQLPF